MSTGQIFIKFFISTASIQHRQRELQQSDAKQRTVTERPIKKAKLEDEKESKSEHNIHSTSACFSGNFLSNLDHERTIRVLLRLFPEKKRSVLETVLREYKGNIVDVLERLVPNQEILRTMPALINTPFPPTFFPSSSRFPYFSF